MLFKKFPVFPQAEFYIVEINQTLRWKCILNENEIIKSLLY